MPAQPHPPSGSSEGSHVRRHCIDTPLPPNTLLIFFLLLASVAKLHLKALAVLGNALKQREVGTEEL